MATSNDVQQEAVKIGNEWYIPLNLVINQPETTIQQCKEFRPKEDNLADQVNLCLGLDSDREPMDQRNPSLNRFKWTYEPSFIFAYVVTAIGINKVKPKEIQGVFPSRYGLTTQMLGSHLQKYRQKIMKEYGVNASGVKNFMVPFEFNKKQIAVIASQWRDPEFKGIAIQELRNNIPI